MLSGRSVIGISETLALAAVAAVQKIRTLDLKKAPSIAETVDWGRALVLLGAQVLDQKTVRDTLSLLIKYETDVARVKDALPDIVSAR